MDVQRMMANSVHGGFQGLVKVGDYVVGVLQSDANPVQEKEYTQEVVTHSYSFLYTHFIY